MKTPLPVVLTVQGLKLVCDISAVPGWDGFEKLWEYLEKHFDATCESKTDGPDVRRWVIRVRGAVLELLHEDPWGNQIQSTNTDSQKVLRDIAADLERRFNSS
jgi:hypothetical protein